jgi:hypothetical protein
MRLPLLEDPLEPTMVQAVVLGGIESPRLPLSLRFRDTVSRFLIFWGGEVRSAFVVCIE